MATIMNEEDSAKLLPVLMGSSDLLVFELIYRTGCRTHELRTLQPQDGMVLIRAAKGGRNHHVPVDAEFLLRLECHWGEIKHEMERVGWESYKAMLRQKWARLRAMHKFLKPYSLHSLRGGFATKVYRATKGDIMITKQLLGHVNLNSTAHYIQTVSLDAVKTQILDAVSANPIKKVT